MASRGWKGDGIFCLEGEWGTELGDRSSVLPILDLLDRLGLAPSVRRDVATREEFFHHLNRWSLKSNRRFPILYIACHGWDQMIYLRPETLAEERAVARGKYDEDQTGAPFVDLDEIEYALKGKAVGRPIYFGSCSTLRADDKLLKAFARSTGAPAVVGYENDVDWLLAASFEVLLLDHLARNSHNARFFSKVVRSSGVMAEELGLVVATKSKVHRAATAARKSV